MKKFSLVFLLILVSIAVLPAQEADTTYWKKNGVSTLNFTNTGFSDYWQAGGVASISIGGLLNLSANYEKENATWSNTLDMGYGVIRQGGNDASWRKNDDRFELNSKYGHKISEHLFFTGLANFRTQFAPGVTFDNTGAPVDTISKLLTPAYLNFSLGLDYKPSDVLSVYYSPVNSKVTIVSDTAFSTRYMPAEFAGRHFRYEIGSYLNVKFKKELVKNVTLQSKADFFMNYLQNFGNVDVNWENLLSLQVNKYIVTSVFTHLIYDDDIRFDLVDENGEPTGMKGPRTQFKHVLSIGLTYKFLQK